MSSSPAAIRILDVYKRYDKTLALDGISFEVAPGEVCGLLGPNGAGKSTLMRCATTLLRQDAGRIELFGHDTLGDPRGARRQFGYVAQQVALDKYLSGREHLQLQAALYHIPKNTEAKAIDDVLTLVGLTEVAERRISTYSGGMARRLDLATALIHKPRLLILDEPTVGLDIHTRTAIWDFILRLASEGVAALIASHHIEEIEYLADRVVIADHGKVVANGTAAELKVKFGKGAEAPTLDDVFLQATGRTLRDAPWLANDTPPVKRRR